MLFNKNSDKDNCGFGMIAHKDGEASFDLLQTALKSLTRMTHRGAIAADGISGDGCGILLSLPDVFLREQALNKGWKLDERYALGVVFLPRDFNLKQQRQKDLESFISQQGLRVVGWRDVPMNLDVCGEQALVSAPFVSHLYLSVPPSIGSMELERRLFVARRSFSKHIPNDDSITYVASLSARVMVYKGLVLPKSLAKLYPDLNSPHMAASIAIFHQRFSTNTLPQWSLAQPFRFLAHNGEINTIAGNRQWTKARAKKFSTRWLPDIEAIAPLVNMHGSDSSSLDNMLEFLYCGGIDIFRAMRLLVPPAWQNIHQKDTHLRAFYEYHAMHMEPWDGPAGIVLTDGRYAACALDRNGLRPARYMLTKQGYLTLASEIGVYDVEPEDVIEKGRVGPGEMFAVDTYTGRILSSDKIDKRLKKRRPYRRWLNEHQSRLDTSLNENWGESNWTEQTINKYRQGFLLTIEEINTVLKPMALHGQEATGSMGDDSPLAPLSSRPRLLYDYFRQQFAQVTNPPIDSLRENIVMSLETYLGPELNIFDETVKHASRYVLSSPVLSKDKFEAIKTLPQSEYRTWEVLLFYDKVIGIKKTIEQICNQAVRKINDEGVALIILSDRYIDINKNRLHILLVVGALHNHLIECGLRCDVNIVCETGTVRDAHQCAVLFGFGATLVYPYLALAEVISIAKSEGVLAYDAGYSYIKSLEKGLTKILSKMGISTMTSYRGAQLFECFGLGDDIVSCSFKGVPSRIGGVNFSDLEKQNENLVESFKLPNNIYTNSGRFKFIYHGEYHGYNPNVVMALQKVARSGDKTDYSEFQGLVNRRPISHLRDLLTLKPATRPIEIDDVEPIKSILSRFDTAAMSLGALSPEAHEALAIAMNRLGGRSNSGEGGEDKKRYNTERVSKIKQVASGRFGVTPAYLVNAEVLQIKIAQGAKPGEGGQLPGKKVNSLIAELRHSKPGITLISPPPHHDIYSIEDLAQLIFDLKEINPTALISVKLVAVPGVGTIAAGVAKAYADMITISGNDGGTGASPLTSIKYAGSAWELGLAEAHQALVSTNLRGRIRLQTDGGFKTGLDVVKAAILGAESFGFGTAPMVALGCKYLRVCHLNNCATGVATQNERLRQEHFIGLPEMVMNYFKCLAEEVREHLAVLGVKRLEEIIGQTQYLEQIAGETDVHSRIDLSDVLAKADSSGEKPLYCKTPSNPPYDKSELMQSVMRDCEVCLNSNMPGVFTYKIKNFNRSVPVRLSGEIARLHGDIGVRNVPIKLNFHGTAGQSFGAFNVAGLELTLIGDANDYVGKGMGGGKIILRRPDNSQLISHKTPICGNTCLYGATGGSFWAEGRAGERFAVRNSGAKAVVEGVGDHGCEYMTGGVVVVLGETGINFGAGMTGGMAYVFDESRRFVDKYNHDLVDIHRLNTESMRGHSKNLYNLINEYVSHTQSIWGSHLIEHFDEALWQFWLVKPKALELEGLLKHLKMHNE